MIRNLKELIAKRCRQKAILIFEFFDELRKSIINKPKDVEQLTTIMQKMENIPQELKQFEETISECLNIYDILENYEFKFPKKDLDKRWEIFGSPKDIMELCEQRR